MSNKSKTNRNPRKAQWSNCVSICSFRFVQFCSRFSLKRGHLLFTSVVKWSPAENKIEKVHFIGIDIIGSLKWNCSYSNRHCVSIIYPFFEVMCSVYSSAYNFSLNSECLMQNPKMKSSRSGRKKHIQKCFPDFRNNFAARNFYRFIFSRHEKKNLHRDAKHEEANKWKLNAIEINEKQIANQIGYINGFDHALSHSHAVLSHEIRVKFA